MTFHGAILIIMATFTAVISGCGSGSPDVGSGAAFSTLSPQPKGIDLYVAIGNATNDATRSSRLAIPKLSSLPFGLVSNPTHNAITFPASQSTEKSNDCPRGGKVVTKTTVSATPTSGTISLDSSFDDCAVTIKLNEKNYKETISGSVSGSSKFQQNTLEGSTDVGLTVSGDLGLSMECGIEGTINLQELVDLNDLSSQKLTGSCVFKDKEDKELTATAQEIQDSHVALVHTSLN